MNMIVWVRFPIDNQHVESSRFMIKSMTFSWKEVQLNLFIVDEYVKYMHVYADSNFEKKKKT